MLLSLELLVPVARVDQNYVVTRILEKVEELEREKHTVLFILDNADQRKRQRKEKLDNYFRRIF